MALLAELGDGAKVLAGGQSLVPMLSLRLAAFDHLVDVGRIGELAGVHVAADGVTVGAGTTQATIEASAEVAAAVPLLARATPLIGHFQIRNRGTLGGSLAHADPAAEYPAVALAMDAEMEVVSAGGRRRLAAADFFTGFWSTALEHGEGGAIASPPAVINAVADALAPLGVTIRNQPLSPSEIVSLIASN